MPDKPFLDTNVIVYAFSADDPRSEKAYALLEAGGSDDVALCIAAEALAAEGRPADARALGGRVRGAGAAAYPRPVTEAVSTGRSE